MQNLSQNAALMLKSLTRLQKSDGRDEEKGWTGETHSWRKTWTPTGLKKTQVVLRQEWKAREKR